MSSNPPARGDFSFPAILYGTASATRGAWKRLVTEAQQAKSWGTSLSSLEHVPVNSLPGYIILHDSGPGATDRHQPHWRLLWVHRLWVNRRQLFCDDPDVTRLHQDLILAGMARLWFTLGMLEFGGKALPAFLPFYAEPSQPHQDRFVTAFMNQVCWWLPDIISLGNRLALGVGVILRYDDRANPILWHGWLASFLYLAYKSRLAPHPNEFRELIQSRYDWDILLALASEGLIQEVNGRFRLCE